MDYLQGANTCPQKTIYPSPPVAEKQVNHENQLHLLKSDTKTNVSEGHKQDDTVKTISKNKRP